MSVLVAVAVAVAVAVMLVLVRLADRLRSAHESEMTMRLAIGMAVQPPAVAMEVCVGGEHRVKLAQAAGCECRLLDGARDR